MTGNYIRLDHLGLLRDTAKITGARQSQTVIDAKRMGPECVAHMG